jgi:Fe-S cluster biogenesis protein NfuA
VLPSSASGAFYGVSDPANLCSTVGTGAGQCATGATAQAGVAVDSSTHDVFLVDAGNLRVSQFSASGAFIRSFGAGVADGTTQAPQVCTALCFRGVNSGSGAVTPNARGIAVDPSTHIVYVVSAPTRVAYFDGTTGTFLGELTAASASPPGPLNFVNATGVAVDRSGPQAHLYLARGNGTTSVVDKYTVPTSSTPAGYVCQITGKSVASATECHGSASQDGVFNGLDFTLAKGGNIAVDSAGTLYIAQTVNRNVVSRYDSTGGFVSQFTVPGAVAVAVGPTGNLFVSTHGTGTVGGTHVREYDPANTSTPLSDFGTGTIGGSFGIAVDTGGGPSGGHVYASDHVNGKVWNFAQGIERVLTVAKAGGGSGTVTSSPPGISCGAACTAGFLAGRSVTLTAAPTPDSVFTGWSGACSGTGPCNVTMDADKAVTANFAPAETLTVTKTGAGAGSVTSSPPGIDCGATCAVGYTNGTVVTLTATPAAGSRFAGWSGACSGIGSCNVTMDADKAVTANFVQIKTLTILKTGTGAGTVTSAPAGIDCGPVCAADYDAGTVVVLTAAPAVGSRFVGWSGACTGTDPCSVTMDAAKEATANFTLRREVTVTKAGAGTGSVIGDPPGIDCGLVCTATFDDGTSVALTATAASGSVFTGWSGACTGTGRCLLTMDSAKHVTAHFALTKTLTVAKAGQGTGTVDSAPGGISCGSSCTALFATGAPVVLIASPAANSQFVGWSGACSGVGSCHVTMDDARTVTATFVEKAPAVTTTPGALAVTQTGATVRGTVDPRGNAVTACRIEYGTSRAYRWQVPCSPASLGTGMSAVGVAGALSALTPGTTYHFRVVASGAGGTSRGRDMTFTTVRARAALTVAGRAAVLGRSARLRLACAGSAPAQCSGRLRLTARVGGKPKRALRVGAVAVRLAAGETETVKVRLSPRARSLLKRRGSLRVTVEGLGLEQALTLRRPKR